MGVTTNTLTYITTVSDTNGRRLRTETFNVNGNASIKAAVPLSSTSYTSADSLYTGVTTSLGNAVENGDFTIQLQTVSILLDATSTASAVATFVSYSQPLIVNTPSSGQSNSLSTGILAAIVICATIGFALLCAGIYYVLFSFAMEGSSGSDGVTQPRMFGRRKDDLEIFL